MFLIYQFGEPTSDVIEPADSNKQVSDKKVEEKTSAVPAELINLHAARLPSGEILSKHWNVVEPSFCSKGWSYSLVITDIT